MSIKQISYGRGAEREFAKMMKNRGWWIHGFINSRQGQPCDFILTKRNVPWFIDVKNIGNSNVMGFGRLEENQINSFKLLSSTGAFNTGWVLRFKHGDYRFLSFTDYLMMIEDGRFAVTKEELLSWWVFIQERPPLEAEYDENLDL